MLRRHSGAVADKHGAYVGKLFFRVKVDRAYSVVKSLYASCGHQLSAPFYRQGIIEVPPFYGQYLFVRSFEPVKLIVKVIDVAYVDDMSVYKRHEYDVAAVLYLDVGYERAPSRIIVDISDQRQYVAGMKQRVEAA